MVTALLEEKDIKCLNELAGKNEAVALFAMLIPAFEKVRSAGNDLMINITQEAADRLSEILQKFEYSDDVTEQQKKAAADLVPRLLNLPAAPKKASGEDPAAFLNNL